MENITTFENVTNSNSYYNSILLSEYISLDLRYIYMSLIKLTLSTILSFIISIERELHTHPGGICTHTLVGFGSCLITMVSVNLRDKFPASNSDPARICAQIVSGVGFLGSATIFRSNNYVKGINTAANLWISAAISMAIGADLWELAASTSIFVLFVLLINNRYKKYRYGKYNKKKVKKHGLKPDRNIRVNDNDNIEIEIELPRPPDDAPYGNENCLKTD